MRPTRTPSKASRCSAKRSRNRLTLPFWPSASARWPKSGATTDTGRRPEDRQVREPPFKTEPRVCRFFCLFAGIPHIDAGNPPRTGLSSLNLGRAPRNRLLNFITPLALRETLHDGNAQADGSAQRIPQTGRVVDRRRDHV